MSLKKNLDQFKSSFLPQVSEQIKESMRKAEETLKESNIAERALAAGNDAVDFTLPNAKGEQVSSTALRQQGPIVVSFYRGGWCPYCSLELKALQNVNSEIEAGFSAGATPGFLVRSTCPWRKAGLDMTRRSMS